MLKLIKITDNGGKTMDRYTAYFKGDGEIDGDYTLCMSHNCKSPQGVCMSDTTKPDWIEADDGKVMVFTDCPYDVQVAIVQFRDGDDSLNKMTL
ncbi:hypothetical protein LCGC14_0415740 [marine sediment metagenome]|uniref:Uncharacterized protein n=1 Tax=marine sediment metagenome TaxID=412755 RepID=A0A0F9W1J9_9ZZZZ